MNYTFKGNFGTLVLVVDDNGNASGTYQEVGTLSGTFKEGEFEGEWENKGMEGLVKFTVKEGRLNGKWKKGKESGAMRGRVYVGKYEKKGDSLILNDTEARMYIIDNKLYEFPEKRTRIELIKTE